MRKYDWFPPILANTSFATNELMFHSKSKRLTQVVVANGAYKEWQLCRAQDVIDLVITKLLPFYAIQQAREDSFAHARGYK